MSELSLITVPHTGTHFVLEYMSLLGIEHNAGKGFFHCHPPLDFIDRKSKRYEPLFNRKCVVTARDPYLMALRYIRNGQAVSQAAVQWNVFLDALSDMDYFVLDVGCRKSDREQHLIDLSAFLGKRNEAIAKEYAAEWKPLNYTDSGAKGVYLNRGVLPNKQEIRDSGNAKIVKIDWSGLEDAVAWYKTLKTNDFGDK